MVDTCGGEFEAVSPYFYSTYGTATEAKNSGRKTVVVLGSGPIRIGQGIEFDYCSVHCVWALKRAGFDTVIINLTRRRFPPTSIPWIACISSRSRRKT